MQNGLNHSKLAVKQQKRPNSTKAENWSKTLKKAKKNENFLELDFRTKYQNTFFLTKKKFLWPNRFNISLNLLLPNDHYGLTTQNLKIGQKRQKLLKHNENSQERVFMTKQQNKIFDKKKLFFDQNCLKTLEIIENLFRNGKTAQTAQKLKVGQNSQKLIQKNENRLKVILITNNQ